MNSPLTSVVIPCYNAEGYVGEAIESALNQTYRPVEVIVIDDGSTDGSLDVIRSFGDRIRYESGPNRGPSAARNRGVQLARGELIQFLDADDVLHPEKRSLDDQSRVASQSHGRPILRRPSTGENRASSPRAAVDAQDGRSRDRWVCPQWIDAGLVA